jgi:hypothetical protein
MLSAHTDIYFLSHSYNGASFLATSTYSVQQKVNSFIDAMLNRTDVNACSAVPYKVMHTSDQTSIAAQQPLTASAPQYSVPQSGQTLYVTKWHPHPNHFMVKTFNHEDGKSMLLYNVSIHVHDYNPENQAEQSSL